MKSTGVVIIVLLVALFVVGVLAVAQEGMNSTVTRTSTFTTTIGTPVTVTSTYDHTTTVFVYTSSGSAGHGLVGNCTVTNYFVPDTVEAVPVNVTVTSAGSTFTGTSWSELPQQTDVGVKTTYETTIYANETGPFTFASTSTGDYVPSAGWTVTACTFKG